MFSNILINSQCFIGTVSQGCALSRRTFSHFPLSSNPLLATVYFLEALSSVDNIFLFIYFSVSETGDLDWNIVPFPHLR